jgi:hypothetical protein
MIEARVAGELDRRLYEEERDRYLPIRHDLYVREKCWRPESPSEWSVVAYVRCDRAALAGIRRLLGSNIPRLVTQGRQKPFFPHAVAA